MKKFAVFALLVVLVGVFAVFAAGTTTYPNYPAYTGPQATITMWAWTSNENYSIAAFEKAYPKIHVVWSNFGVDYTKILTATAAGKGLADVLMSEYLSAPQFMEYGSFQPITKWVPESLYLKFFPKDSLKWVSMDGRIYGTPQDSGAMIMVYRKDIFDKYGLTVPTTWKEYEQDAAKLHSENPNIKFSNFPNAGSDFAAMVQQAGGRLFDYANGKWYIDFTNQTAEKVADYWTDMVKNGYADKTPEFTADWFKEIDQGQIATIIMGAWFPEWLQLNSPKTKGLWRVATVPQWDPAHPYNGVMGGSGFYVSSQCKNPEAAALFVLWLNSNRESLKDLNKYSGLPVLVSNVFSDEVAPSLDTVKYPYFGNQAIVPVEVKANEQVKTSFVYLPVMDYFQTSYLNERAKVYAGKETLSDALKILQNEIASFMKKQGFENLVAGQLPQ